MRPVSLWRTTPFRIGLWVAGTALVSYLVVTVLFATEIRARVQEINDRSITEVFRLIRAQAETTGAEGLAGGVNALLRERGTDRLMILVRDSGGAALVGNMRPLDLPEGWSTVPGAALGRAEVGTFRFFAGPVGPFVLAVGASNDEVAETLAVIRSVLAWAGVVAAAVTLALAARIAAGIRARQAGFQTAMGRIAEGDLAARIPLSGRDDDIDRLSAEINAALGRLETGVEALKQVSSDIAHDLRTPLGRLDRHVATAMEQTRRGRDATAELEAAQDESAGIAATFEALLRIAQIEAGARRARFRPVDLAEVAREVVETYQPVAEDAGLRLDLGRGGAPAQVPGDRELLVQALVNLVENAIRHCPAGTRVSVSLLPGPALVVRDDGPGLPEAERAKATRRLYRGDKSRGTPGSGLGLALVKAVADLHGATLALEDAGPGLAVRLRFPAGAAGPARGAAQSSVRRNRSSARSA
jgi:signal transduction histidine kinase